MFATQQQLVGAHKFEGALACDVLADDLSWLLRRRLADPVDVPVIRRELWRRHNRVLISERRRKPLAS